MPQSVRARTERPTWSVPNGSSIEGARKRRSGFNTAGSTGRNGTTSASSANAATMPTQIRNNGRRRNAASTETGVSAFARDIEASGAAIGQYWIRGSIAA